MSIPVMKGQHLQHQTTAPYLTVPQLFPMEVYIIIEQPAQEK